MKSDLIKRKFQKEKVLKKILDKSDQKIDDKIMSLKITKKIDNKRSNQAFNELLKKQTYSFFSLSFLAISKDISF